MACRKVLLGEDEYLSLKQQHPGPTLTTEVTQNPKTTASTPTLVNHTKSFDNTDNRPQHPSPSFAEDKVKEAIVTDLQNKAGQADDEGVIEQSTSPNTGAKNHPLADIPPKFLGLARKIINTLSCAPSHCLRWNPLTGGQIHILDSPEPHPTLTIGQIVKSLLYPHLGTKGVPLELVIALSKLGFPKTLCKNRALYSLIRTVPTTAGRKEQSAGINTGKTVGDSATPFWLPYGVRPMVTLATKPYKKNGPAGSSTRQKAKKA